MKRENAKFAMVLALSTAAAAFGSAALSVGLVSCAEQSVKAKTQGPVTTAPAGNAPVIWTSKP